jgi:transposase
VKRYLEQLDAADEQDEVVIDPGAVAAALEKLKSHLEPEARLMRMGSGFAPAYNVQTAVDAEHALIVAQQVTEEGTDNRSLLPMAQAAKSALGDPPLLHVVADAGYSNGEQAEACESQGIVPHVPANRAVHNHGAGKLFDRSEFRYDEKTDTFRSPANQTLPRKQLSRKDRAVYYAGDAAICGACALKARCTEGAQRLVSRHLHEGALQRMQSRATPEAMRLRRSTVEHPFAALKYHIFGHPRFLLRGRQGAQAETSLATIVYNLKRMRAVLDGTRLRVALAD